MYKVLYQRLYKPPSALGKTNTVLFLHEVQDLQASESLQKV